MKKVTLGTAGLSIWTERLRVLIREVTRHVLVRVGLDALMMRRRTARGMETRHLLLPNRAETFAAIYDLSVWQPSASGSLSGVGSDHASTALLGASLARTVRELGANSLVDVGCGDFSWMSEVDLGGVQYVGLDVVSSLVEQNQRRYAREDRTFIVLDAVSEPLPPGDVVLCREVLFHLSLKEGAAVLKNIIDCGAKYLIATTDSGTKFNSDIRTGDYRMLNLSCRPFSLPRHAPSYLGSISDGAVSSTRYLGIWSVGHLRQPSQGVRPDTTT